MIFSTAAVRSLSSLLVVAMATTTPSGVGGAVTMNRKLSKNTVGGAAPSTTKCPTATLYYPMDFNNTLGSPHIIQKIPVVNSEGFQKLCDPDDYNCIGDTHIESYTLYADPGLTKKVATLGSTAKTVDIRDDATLPGETAWRAVFVLTGSIVYDDTNAKLNYSGNWDLQGFQSVSGGTQECALAFGTIGFSNEGKNNYGSIEFNLVAH